ncbi:MAG: hypothetical protein GY856_17340 [bacterium]|nr:hypothetical protein [bacterium]
MELKLASGEVQRYAVSVPQLQPGEVAPLVLALHYGGEVTPYYGWTFLKEFVAPAFRDLDAFIIAPDCPRRRWTHPKSEQAVLALMEHALQSWPVDSQRTVITGFSLGGIGTWYMAARHPEKWSAAVPVAGRPAGKLDGSVPVYAVHSRMDEVLLLAPTKRAIEALRAKGVTAELVVVKDVWHHQTTRFVEPWSGAVEWLKQLWAGGP